MFKQPLIDRNGNPIRLQRELGRGGEGAVFEIGGYSDYVAKIYLSQPDQNKSSKLLAMVGSGSERLLKLAAWPVNSIHSPSGKFVGFVMHKLEGYRPLFELYSPKLRMQSFPKADWRFLIHAAMNTARAFAVIHESGHVIGDVNHGNLLVAEDATVRFIDTDSFQVSVNGNHWFCEVGVATHQPPEMQGRSTYKGLIRTPNHDNFGLAVLIFQMLCLARHPFSGRFLGDGDMPIERAITEFRFAYALDRQTTQMLPPPGTITVSAFTPKIRQFFEQAFLKGGVNGVRPTATEWVIALEELASKLKVCQLNLGHHYLSSLTACPWCEIESKNNFVIFPVIARGSQGIFNITALWKQVLGLGDLRSDLALPERTSTQIIPSAKAKAVRDKLNARGIKAGILCGVVALSSLVFIPSFSFFVILGVTIWQCRMYKEFKVKAIQNIAEEQKIAKMDWEVFGSSWKARIDGSVFNIAKQKLQDLKQKYDALPQERQYHLQNLWNHHCHEQLVQHLDRYRIEAAELEGFGPGRLSTLQSYGIETAGDVEEHHLMIIGGFGEKLTQRLVDWRRQCESLFTFDPSQGNTQSIVASIDRDMAAKRLKIEQELVAGVAQLTEVRTRIEKNRQLALNEASDLLQKYAQATVNAQAARVHAKK